MQQLLASIWFEGLPGFRRKSSQYQLFETLRIAISFPVLSLIYIVAPTSEQGQKMKKPFIKFICNSASYITFVSKYILITLLYFTMEQGRLGIISHIETNP